MKKSKIIISVIIIIAVLLSGFFIYVNGLDKAFDPDSDELVTVKIEQGSVTDQIADLLEEKGIIKSASSFRLYSDFKRYGNRYLAGIYEFSPSMTLSEICHKLINGDTASTGFTVPEGYNITQIADRLEEKGVIDRDKFDNLLKNGDFDYWFLRDAQKGENHLEGFLFPETYNIELGVTEEDIITMMLNQFDSIFTDEMKKQADDLGLSINEVMTVASIIERETQVPEERGKVASVIYNRLDIDMPLQMCSTVQYILGEQKEILTNADISIDSPYNTYLNPGLPPGPICCPGLESIKAALNPDKTDYLYFVVSDKLDGTQKFSKDYAQFEKDKAAYYEALEGNN